MTSPSKLRKQAPALKYQPYPLGDIGVIGGRIGRILLPITLWVWPVDWATADFFSVFFQFFYPGLVQL